jgi:hypothetical protein
MSGQDRPHVSIILIFDIYEEKLITKQNLGEIFGS